MKINENSADLLTKYHYLGGAPRNIIYALEHPDAVLCFAPPSIGEQTSNNRRGLASLNFARCVKRPGASVLISSLWRDALRWIRAQHKWDYVSTLADPAQGHTGGLYRALSFQYAGETASHFAYDAGNGPQKSYGNGASVSRAFCRQMGWRVIEYPPKLRFVFPLKQKRKVSLILETCKH